HQDRASPDAVTEIAEVQTTDRSGDEAHRERSERGQEADEWARRRVEQLVEHQDRDRAEDDEVVPLDQRAGEAGCNNASERLALRWTGHVQRHESLRFRSIGMKK